jgi:hypothetical protein
VEKTMMPFLLAMVVILLILAALVRGHWLYQRDFAEKFPSISDAEFVAKCSPGVRPEIALRVRRIVADNLGVNYDRIHPSMRFVEDIGAD